MNTPNLVARVAPLLLVGCFVGSAGAEENASNPLAAVNNTDFRYRYIDIGASDLQDIYIDGAFMATPDLKLK